MYMYACLIWLAVVKDFMKGKQIEKSAFYYLQALMTE